MSVLLAVRCISDTFLFCSLYHIFCDVKLNFSLLGTQRAFYPKQNKITTGMGLNSILHALPAVRNSFSKIQTHTHTRTHTQFKIYKKNAVYYDKTTCQGMSFSLVIGKSQTCKRLRIKLFIRTKHNPQYSRVIPFIKLRNNT